MTKTSNAVELTVFRDLLPVRRRAVVDLLIELKKWPMLKEFISAESQEVQQAFEVFMKSLDKIKIDIADLHNAVRQGNEELIQSLIDKGVDINGKEGYTGFNYTPLHVATLVGGINMVKLLLQHGAAIDSKDNEHATPLHYAASLKGDNSMVKMFITAGASITSKEKTKGWTPLHCAVGNNNIECARTLIKHRAPIDAVALKNRTPLHVAASYGLVEMVKLLLQHEATINSCDNDSCTPLHLAAEENEHQVVDVLLGAGALVSPKDIHGRTPLHNACLTGAINCVTYLLERGAKPNTTDNDGATALHFANYEGNNGSTALDEEMYNKYADVVKILIEYGANVDARRIDLTSALHTASTKGNVAIVTLLLRAGANPNSATEEKKTPLQLAQAGDHNEVAAILVKYGALLDKQTSNNS